MRVRVCERKREREEVTLMNTMIKWGMSDYIEKYHQHTKIPSMEYIYNPCAKVHMCGYNIGTYV